MPRVLGELAMALLDLGWRGQGMKTGMWLSGVSESKMPAEAGWPGDGTLG